MDAAPLLKRKGEDWPELGVDDVSASGFPVSSRATKIRRLDAEVPPVVAGVRVQPRPIEGLGVAEVPMCGDEMPVAVAPAPNEERAIVLYSPTDAARNLLLGPLRPDVPLRVNHDWIHELKSTMLLRETSDHRALFEELARDENSNLAMVPWVPSNSQEPSTAAAAAMAAEMMDAEDTEVSPMEVEQYGASHPASAGVGPQGESQAPYQWPQHCMVQQPLPAASYQSSPVPWL